MSLKNKLKESEKNMGKVLKVREVGEPNGFATKENIEKYNLREVN